MKTIKLYGDLGKRFGRVHSFNVQTVAEAIRALCVNFKGFEAYFVERERGYKITVGRDALDKAERIAEPVGEREVIKIIPVLSGAKNATTQILIGAAIVGLAFATGGASLGATGIVTSGILGQMAVGVGVSMMLGGVAQLLTPSPIAEAPKEKAENKPSYTFSGPVNTTAQGHPVPVGYGRMIVGSAVISAGIRVKTPT